MSKHSQNNSWILFFTGLGLGLGLGFGLGVLEAPDSGERTRRRFARKAERVKDSVSEQLKQFNAKN